MSFDITHKAVILKCPQCNATIETKLGNTTDRITKALDRIAKEARKANWNTNAKQWRCPNHR